MIACVNLRELFGAKYRIGYDPAYFAEHGGQGRTDDPWLQVIPCRHGEIFPYGDGVLAVATNSRGSICTSIMALAGTVVVQDAADGLNIAFPLSMFDQVAQIVKPRRKRRLTDKQRAGSRERLKKFQFRPAAQSDLDGRNRHGRRTDDPNIDGRRSKRNLPSKIERS